MNSYHSDYKEVGVKKHSEIGQKIDYLCQLLNEEERITQTQLVALSALFIEKEILDPQVFHPIGNTSNLSKAKKHSITLPKERVKQIFNCIEKMAEAYGYANIQYPGPKDKKAKLIFSKIPQHPDLPRKPRGVQRKELQNNGVTGLVETMPLEHTEFYKEFFKAQKLRIIQSTLYNWKDFTRKLERALIHKNLFDVKILLGQPYSEVAFSRSHTLGLDRDDQFNFFNQELEQAITKILKIIEELNGTPKKGTEHTYNIELKIYHRTTAFPLYQCLDENDRNLFALVGHFWEHNSSYLNPHLVITGMSGTYLKSINDHFLCIWNEEPTASLNWKDVVSKQKTLEVKKGTDIENLFYTLRKAFYLRPFTVYHADQPKWLYFKCFYYNFDNEATEFLLQIAPNRRIARVSETGKNNIYYGTVTELHGSYSLYLHTIGPDSDRIIFINLPVGASKLQSHEYRLAIYSNNDPKTGAPYTQLMIVNRLDKEEEYEHKDLSQLSYLIPFLKEKKIQISGNLQNLDHYHWESLNEEYIYHFNEGEKEIYYQNLQRELLAAKNDIIFLGFAPAKYRFSDQPGADSKEKDYYSLLKELVTDRKIKITRILVTNTISEEFKVSLIDLHKSKLLGNSYRLYVTKNHIPFPSNIVLIDPDDSQFRRGILSFIKTKKSDGSQRPIRMEAIKHDHQIIENLFETCLGYINNIELCYEVKTLEDIDSYLMVGT